MCWSPELYRHECADRWCHPWMTLMMMMMMKSLSDHHWLSSKPKGRKRPSFLSTEWTHLPDVSIHIVLNVLWMFAVCKYRCNHTLCSVTQMHVGSSLNSRWALNTTAALWYLMRIKLLKLCRKNPNLRSGRRHLLPEPKRMNRNLRSGPMWRCESMMSITRLTGYPTGSRVSVLCLEAVEGECSLLSDRSVLIVFVFYSSCPWSPDQASVLRFRLLNPVSSRLWKRTTGLPLCECDWRIWWLTLISLKPLCSFIITFVLLGCIITLINAGVWQCKKSI